MARYGTITPHLPASFTPTHRSDQVEAALRGYLPSADLAELADLIGKDLGRRERKSKQQGHLGTLQILLERASRTPVAMRWYADQHAEVPLTCVLLDGDHTGEQVTTIPGGVQFRFLEPEEVGDQAWCQPVDAQGVSFGQPTWALDSNGRTVAVGHGIYLIPMDAIRTGNAADTHTAERNS